MVLSFIVFIQDYPFPRALWTSIFHSIAAFNNSGFDILGGLQNLIPYQKDVLLNLTTCALIVFGGLGFLVILDIKRSRCFRKLSLHSKVVISTTIALLLVGTLLLKATEDMSWMGCFFHSVSARTAGFSTYPMGELTNAGLFTLTVLMFIGASPGSTGGGIKTTTFFALMQDVRSEKPLLLLCYPCWLCLSAPSCYAFWSQNAPSFSCCLRWFPLSAQWGFLLGLRQICAFSVNWLSF